MWIFSGFFSKLSFQRKVELLLLVLGFGDKPYSALLRSSRSETSPVETAPVETGANIAGTLYSTYEARSVSYPTCQG